MNTDEEIRKRCKEYEVFTRVIKAAMIIILMVGILLMIIGAWRVERWLNWKYGYGPRVERRLETIEKRIKQLEERDVRASDG